MAEDLESDFLQALVVENQPAIEDKGWLEHRGKQTLKVQLCKESVSC